jgi:hypothetical protein
MGPSGCQCERSEPFQEETIRQYAHTFLPIAVTFPLHFVFDKEARRGRGYQQYEQSAGMDRNTLSPGCNMDR